MKTKGKINTHIREETQKTMNHNVPRANIMRNSKNNDEVDELIKHHVEVILDKKECDANTLIEVVDKYRKYQQGQYVVEEFLAFLESLFAVPVCDCDEIVLTLVTSCSIERKETNYERSESIFTF